MLARYAPADLRDHLWKQIGDSVEAGFPALCEHLLAVIADPAAGQRLLLSLMDPRADTSVEVAIMSDRTLGGNVQDVFAEKPSAYGYYGDLQGESLLGCVWRTGMIL